MFILKIYVGTVDCTILVCKMSFWIQILFYTYLYNMTLIKSTYFWNWNELTVPSTKLWEVLEYGPQCDFALGDISYVNIATKFEQFSPNKEHVAYTCQ